MEHLFLIASHGRDFMLLVRSKDGFWSKPLMRMLYEHAAEWAECLNWDMTPVLTDEEAGPLMGKAYS